MDWIWSVKEKRKGVKGHSKALGQERRQAYGLRHWKNRLEVEESVRDVREGVEWEAGATRLEFSTEVQAMWSYQHREGMKAMGLGEFA